MCFTGLTGASEWAIAFNCFDKKVGKDLKKDIIVEKVFFERRADISFGICLNLIDWN